MSAFQAKMDRLDALLDQRLKREEAEQARADASLEDARRAKMRQAAEQRREIQAVYADAYRAFGTEVPAPVDDEAPMAFRKRLFNRLARRLPSGHDLADVRADDLGGQAIVFDNFERMLIEAATAEGEKPSVENLPDDGMVMRTRTDANTGTKFNEFYGKRSFIADMKRPSQRVLRLVNPKTGDVLKGAPFPKDPRPAMWR